MCHRSRTVLCLLAVCSGLLLVASLFLPTSVVVLILPSAGIIADTGSVWSASKALALLVAVVLVPAIVAPCFTSIVRRWMLPLLVTALATLALAFMVICNFFLANGFGFTIIGLAAVALLGVCTLAEAIAARRLANAAARPTP